MLSYVKEEIDISFDENDFIDYMKEQQMPCEAAYDAIVETNIQKNVEIQHAPLDIKKEISEDIISMRCEKIAQEILAIQTEVQSVNDNVKEKVTRKGKSAIETEVQIVHEIVKEKEPRKEIEKEKPVIQTEIQIIKEIVKEKEPRKEINGEDMEVDVTTVVNPGEIIDNLKIQNSKVRLERTSIKRIRTLSRKCTEKSAKVQRPTVAVEPAQKREKIAERRVLRSSRRKNLKKDVKEVKSVLNKRLELRGKNPKFSNDTTKKPSKPKYVENSRISAFIRQHCRKCKIVVEEGHYVVRKCWVCKVPFVYECAKCKKVYETKSGIKNHLDTKCYPRSMHYCKCCKYSTAKYEHMKRHVRNIHEAECGQLSAFIRSKNL